MSDERRRRRWRSEIKANKETHLVWTTRTVTFFVVLRRPRYPWRSFYPINRIEWFSNSVYKTHKHAAAPSGFNLLENFFFIYFFFEKCNMKLHAPLDDIFSCANDGIVCFPKPKWTIGMDQKRVSQQKGEKKAYFHVEQYFDIHKWMPGCWP